MNEDFCLTEEPFSLSYWENSTDHPQADEHSDTFSSCALSWNRRNNRSWGSRGFHVTQIDETSSSKHGLLGAETTEKTTVKYR